MEKIKLVSGEEFSLIVCGIMADAQTVTMSGEQLAIYNGYTQLQSITQELDAVIGYTQDEEQTPITGKLVTAVLRKVDTTEKRLMSLEETVDILVMESIGL